MSSDPNPYCSPQVDDEADWLLQRTLSFGNARGRVRTAAMIGIAAPLVEYVGLWGVGLRAAYDDDVFVGEFYIDALIMGAVALSVLSLAAWFCTYPAIRLASMFVRVLVARRVPLAKWQKTTDGALWTLPYAAMLGVITWSIYSSGNFGGWPDDVIFGAIGNVIGAWCYLTIFVAWFRVWRATCSVD